MKVVGKRKSWSSEVPAEAGAPLVVGGTSVGSDTNELLASSGENGQTRLQPSIGGDSQGPDSDAEAEEEEDEGEEEENEDGEGNGVGQDSERPKLDEGFYEIEAIRRRRVRKGQLQYLIKWRGWSEAANTWEPMENLQSCSDFIDAFEESLRSGRNRKRKRRSSILPQSQPKKKQHSCTSSLGNSVAGFVSNLGDSNIQSKPFNNFSDANISAFPHVMFPSHEGHCAGITSTLEYARPAENENATSHSFDGIKKLNEYDPKLSELKATTSINGVDTDIPETQFQDCTALQASGASFGPTKFDCQETVESSRCRGAKKRKSGCVKRFRKDSQEAPTITGAGISNVAKEHLQTCLTDPLGYNSCFSSKIHDSRTSGIVKIIKAVGYSASMSSSGQDVFVSFKALRSDGTEVTVDNKYLKAYDPLLLINFYEQHLRYHP